MWGRRFIGGLAGLLTLFIVHGVLNAPLWFGVIAGIIVGTFAYLGN